MKRVLVLVGFLFASLSVSAQDTEKKNIYVEDGDLIKATIFYDSGELSQTGFFTKEGKLTGEWVSYSREGVKTAEAKYNNGSKVGTWFFWTEDKLTEVDYTNSKVASVNVWENTEKSEVVINK